MPWTIRGAVGLLALLFTAGTAVHAQGAKPGSKLKLPPSVRSSHDVSVATTKHVAELENVQEFLAALGHQVEKINMNLALIGGNKYMLSNCLGIKASAGEFTFQPGAPSLRTEGSGILMQFVVKRITMNGLMIRVRPNTGNPTNLCHFSRRFGVGGSASNVRFEIRWDPLLDMKNCKVSSPGALRQSVAIGGLNLKPLQNDLDKAAKNMIEETINLYLDAPSWNEIVAMATASALKTTCVGDV